MKPSLSRLAAVVGALGLATASHANERVQCTQESPTRQRCRIDEPNVKQRMTTYSAIALQVNDRVLQVEAGGCVQTGGSGKTWKRYVNPSGSNADRLYHGLIQLPGMPGPRRLLDFGSGPYTVPAGTGGSIPFLQLGYEDDGYGDNGYWGHDDGTQDQCRGVGPAWVQFVIERAPQSPSTCVGEPPADLKGVCCAQPGAPAPVDADRDGVPDACEQALAERYAPIVYHSTDESNFPTNVDWFLPKTELWYYDDACEPDFKQRITQAPSQAALLTGSMPPTCGSPGFVRSNGTRSDSKQRTFFLADVADTFRRGSMDTKDWRTYVHAYRNTLGGVTLQYWRFYAYNDAINNHGGDWEGEHVILDRQLRPARIGLMGHTSVDEKPWGAFTSEGNHPRVFSEGGGHATHETGSGIHSRGCVSPPIPCNINPNNPLTFVRQETWASGQVAWPDGRRTPSGGLLNLGEKLHPLNGQVFLQYSGLWGSPGTLFGTSGYWGPAYNETGMDTATHFMTAWCWGLVGSEVVAECHPAAVSR